VFEGVCVFVGVFVEVCVFVGVGVGGMSGHSKVEFQAVPVNGAVTIIVTVDGNALVLLKDAVPLPVPETFGYPKAFNWELYEESPLNPVSITVFPFQITSHLSGIEIALKTKSVFPVPVPTSTVMVKIPLPPLPTQALELIRVLHVVAVKNSENGVALGVMVGVGVGVGVTGVGVGVGEGHSPVSEIQSWQSL
jgi:hypothetical protein